MGDIASSNVTYAQQGKKVSDSGVREYVFKVSFGDGALTYPTGGVPLLKASLGCPNALESLVIFDPENGNGLVYKYDYENAKIRIYQGDNDAVADGPLVELAGGSATPAAADLYVLAKGW